MKTNIKRTLTSMASILAVSAMSVSAGAFAADTNVINKKPAFVLEGTEIGSEIAIDLNKDIILFNVDGENIYEPNITYTYNITAPTTNATISTVSNDTSKTPMTVKVRQGVIEAISTTAGSAGSTATTKVGTITFGNDSIENTPSNTTYKESTQSIAINKINENKITGSLEIKVDASKIYNPNGGTGQVNGPGVYRYKISDVTAASVYKASGVTDGGATNDLYLDVYTKYNDAKDGLVIYGYVLLKIEGNSEQTTTITYVEDKDDGVKVTGFDTESENTDTIGNDNEIAISNEPTANELKSDTYHTYNLTVEKKTDGDMADAQHPFPFSIALENANVSSGDEFAVSVAGETAAHKALEKDTSNNNNNNVATITGSIKNGETIVITGLPAGTKATVAETNDTDDGYSVAAKHFEGLDQNNEEIVTSLTLTNSKSDQQKDVYTAAQIDVDRTDTADKVLYINTLKDISITGLLFNIAPFAFISAAGAALIGLFMKNKKNKDADSMI